MRKLRNGHVPDLEYDQDGFAQVLRLQCGFHRRLQLIPVNGLSVDVPLLVHRADLVHKGMDAEVVQRHDGEEGIGGELGCCTIIYLVEVLKGVEKNLQTTEILGGLTLFYELPEDSHIETQKEIYKLSHPAMDGFVENDVVEVDLLGVKFVFTKI